MNDKVDFGPRIGADPEVFVRQRTDKTKFGSLQIVPICGLVGGTKEKPIPITSIPMSARAKAVGQFAYQEDGVAFEVNVPASRSAEDFTYSIQTVVQHMTAMLADKNLTMDFSKPFHVFTPEQLNLPAAREIGCSPDFNAWEGEAGVKRNPFSDKDLGNERFCGGHLHLQYNYNNVPRHIMAQFMDVVCALPTLFWDKQGNRRKFYGLPGLYREKEYGIEYRTLSNFWLRRDTFEHILYPMAREVLRLGALANEEPSTLELAYSEIPWDDVRRAITTEDYKLGNELLRFIYQTSFPLKRLVDIINYQPLEVPENANA